MASSRLEKIGTIYKRTRGLIQSGAMKYQDRPLWYDIYEAFPPAEEPSYGRPIPNIELKSIFYPEDKIRAAFHRQYKNVGRYNLTNESKSPTQKFLSLYKQLSDQYKDSVSEEQMLEEAMEMFKSEQGKNKIADRNEEKLSLSGAFKEAQKLKEKSEKEINVDVKELFKE